MAQFNNERLRNLRIGISSYTENELALDVIGNTKVVGFLSVTGPYYDSLGSPGSNLEVLTSTVTGTKWFSVTAETLEGKSSFVRTISTDTSSAHYLTFVDSNNPSPGQYESVYTNSGISFVPSTSSLGIGTSAPTAKLSVVGNVNISGIATIQSANILNDLVIGGNLRVDGDEIIANVIQLRVEDKNIVLGFTTSVEPNDTTGNGGGISVASTEGTSLVSLSVAGINTLPDTYKQITWFKGGTFGVGTTDTWLSNYPIGIGTTQVLTGTALNVSGGNVVFNSSNLGIGITNPTSKLQIEDILALETTGTIVSTTSATTIDSFSTTLYRSARFQIQITQGSSYQASDVLVVQDGTSASIIEYGSIATGDYLANFDATVSGGLLNLRVLMNSATTATVKVVRYAITI